MTRPARTLLIDNYDSFTFNLFQLIAEVNGEEPIVVRNDGETWEELATWEVDNIVVSPGPGTPERPSDFGVCADAIRHATVPILAVCLGHQGLAHFAGGSVVKAPEPFHGRLSAVFHDGSGVFTGIPQGFEVVRYHSLCVTEPLPEGLEATAWTADGIVMGLRDVARPRWGVQFHPESICTTYGRTIVENFRDLSLARATPARPRTTVPVGRTIVPGRETDAGPATVAADERSYRLLARRVVGAPDPERAFVHLHGDDAHAWWLDSSRASLTPPTLSFMGSGDGGPLGARVYHDVAGQTVTIVRGDTTEVLEGTRILDYLRGELARIGQAVERDALAEELDFDCGFVGYLGYEVKAETGGSLVHSSTMPDAFFHFADRLLAFEHETGDAILLCLTEAGPEAEAEGLAWLEATEAALRGLPALEPVVIPEGAPPVGVAPLAGRDEYLDDIAQCLQHLIEGESYEICLTNRLEVDVDLEPLPLYRILRSMNPAPYSALLRMGSQYVASSSPERFLRVGRDRWVEAKPIKGTARRGATPEEDARIAEALRADEKSQAENLMITDLLRNDLGIVCEVGSVHVPALFAVESYETVHQLVSTIRGRLRPELTTVDCIGACFPGGSMTGAPKKRTMEIIDDLEDDARGVYSGAIGYLGLSGAADLNIVIRTIVHDGETTTIGVGGAIVMQSDPVDEYEETVLKARVLLQACAAAQAMQAVRGPRAPADRAGEGGARGRRAPARRTAGRS